MQRVHIRKAKPKIKRVREIKAEAKVTPLVPQVPPRNEIISGTVKTKGTESSHESNTASTVPSPQSSDTKGILKEEINAIPILEAMPATHSRDIAPILRPTPDTQEVQRRETSELEPRVRQAARESSAPRAPESREYQTAQVHPYQSTTAYQVLQVYQQDGAAATSADINPAYQSGQRVPARAPLPPILRAGQSREEERFRRGPHAPPENTSDRYDVRPYDIGEARDHTIRTKRKMPP